MLITETRKVMVDLVKLDFVGVIPNSSECVVLISYLSITELSNVIGS